MGFQTDPSAGCDDFPQVEEANKLFAKIKRFGDRALVDLPSHRALIQQIHAQAGRAPLGTAAAGIGAHALHTALKS